MRLRLLPGIAWNRSCCGNNHIRGHRRNRDNQEIIMPASRLTIRAALFDYVLLALLNVYSCGLSLPKPPTRATERSTKRPTDRPTDRSSDRPINRAIDRAIDGVTERSTERPIDRATERSTERPIERPSYQPRDQAIDPATDSYRRLPSDGLVGYRLDSKPLCSKRLGGDREAKTIPNLAAIWRSAI